MAVQVSVVIPMYNEQEVLPLLADRLRPLLDGITDDYEVLCVDDGSRDLTPALLHKLARDWAQVRVVRLRANAGHQAAISAGLALARGAHVVTIDADLQDPPEVIAEMLRRISGTTAQSDAGDFRLMSRATVDAINSLPDHNRVLRFVVPALGFPSASVGYRREERAAGTSKYPFLKMLKLSVDSVTGFSLFPLRLATYLGLLGGVFMFLAAIGLVVASRTGQTIPGWTSTVVIVAGVGAVQLLCLGLLGEYVGRMYTQLQGRPAYFVATDSLAGQPSPALPVNPAGSGEPGSAADLPVTLDDPLGGRQLR
jgi:dolichol-phosphate mannosyltransferase